MDGEPAELRIFTSALVREDMPVSVSRFTRHVIGKRSRRDACSGGCMWASKMNHMFRELANLGEHTTFADWRGFAKLA